MSLRAASFRCAAVRPVPSSATSVTKKGNSRFLSFAEAKEYIKNCDMKFTRVADYRAWGSDGNRPPQLPSCPDLAYAGSGWKGFPDFLGYQASKYDPWRYRSHAVTHRRCSSPLHRGSMRSRREAQDAFLARVRQTVPEYEIMRLSPRNPGIFLYRKRGSSADDPSDRWMLLQAKYASPRSRWSTSEPHRFAFHDVNWRGNTNIVFLTDNAAEIALKCIDDFAGLKEGVKRKRLAVELGIFEAAHVRQVFDSWWIRGSHSSFAEIAAVYRCGSPLLRQHDDVTRMLATEIYEPLGLHVECIFPMDSCERGNVILSGVRCLQKVASAARNNSSGYSFAVNLGWHGGRLSRGNGWRGLVRKYICIVADWAKEGQGPLIRGIFIMPHEYVFCKSDKDKGRTNKETRSKRGSLQVYPAFVNPRNARSMARQAEQARFYIDFETTHRDEQLLKAKELLGI